MAVQPDPDTSNELLGHGCTLILPPQMRIYPEGLSDPLLTCKCHEKYPILSNTLVLSFVPVVVLSKGKHISIHFFPPLAGGVGKLLFAHDPPSTVWE